MILSHSWLVFLQIILLLYFLPLFLTLQHYISFPGLTRKLIVSQVWEPEVQKQVPAGSFLLMAGTRGSALGPSPWLGDSYLSSCLLTLSSLCACLCPSFPSSQGPWSCWTRAHTNDLIFNSMSSAIYHRGSTSGEEPSCQ